MSEIFEKLPDNVLIGKFVDDPKSGGDSRKEYQVNKKLVETLWQLIQELNLETCYVMGILAQYHANISDKQPAFAGINGGASDLRAIIEDESMDKFKNLRKFERDLWVAGVVLRDLAREDIKAQIALKRANPDIS